MRNLEEMLEKTKQQLAHKAAEEEGLMTEMEQTGQVRELRE